MLNFKYALYEGGANPNGGGYGFLFPEDPWLREPELSRVSQLIGSLHHSTKKSKVREPEYQSLISVPVGSGRRLIVICWTDFYKGRPGPRYLILRISDEGRDTFASVLRVLANTVGDETPFKTNWQHLSDSTALNLSQTIENDLLAISLRRNPAGNQRRSEIGLETTAIGRSRRSLSFRILDSLMRSEVVSIGSISPNISPVDVAMLVEACPQFLYSKLLIGDNLSHRRKDWPTTLLLRPGEIDTTIVDETSEGPVYALCTELHRIASWLSLDEIAHSAWMIFAGGPSRKFTLSRLEQQLTAADLAKLRSLSKLRFWAKRQYSNRAIK